MSDREESPSGGQVGGSARNGAATSPRRGDVAVWLLAVFIGAVSILGTSSWGAPWFVLKANRLVAGAEYVPAGVLPWAAYCLLATWLAAGAVALIRDRYLPYVAGPLAALATVLALILAGGGATVLMDGQAGSARVALVLGFWLAVVAAYVAWFGASQLTAGNRGWLLAPAATAAVAVLAYLLAAGHFSDLGIARELANQGADFRAELARHLGLSGTSLLVATLVGVPAAVAAHRNERTAAWLLPTVAFFQTIPSLALFGLMLPPLARLGQSVTVGTALLLGFGLLPLALLWRSRLRWAKRFAWLLALAPLLLWAAVFATVLAGSLTALLGGATGQQLTGGLHLGSALATLGVRGIGATPALIALTLYALLPIVRNAYEGLGAVPAAAIEAGKGMGMSRSQLLWRVEAPLALPLAVEGLRGAAVLIIGITTVAFLIGAGGLGVFIQRGIDQVVPDLVLLGALPVIALALAADGLLRAVGIALTAPPLRHAVVGGTQNAS